MSRVSWKYDVVAVLKMLVENLNDTHKPMVNCTMSKYMNANREHTGGLLGRVRC
jgi:hypothetical protein